MGRRIAFAAFCVAALAIGALAVVVAGAAGVIAGIGRRIGFAALYLAAVVLGIAALMGAAGAFGIAMIWLEGLIL